MRLELPQRRWRSFALLCIGCYFVAGCTGAYVKSVGGDTEHVYSKIYLTDFDMTWQAVLEALKSIPLDLSNREAGYLRTKWIDNTAERNLAESFLSAKAYQKAQYRFRVTVGKGFYNGRPSVKVAVVRDQYVQSDVLEGWRPVPSDSIEENTLLYRIGRLVSIRTALAEREERRAKEAADSIKEP